MGPTWGPSGAGRTQVGPMLAPWTLLSGNTSHEISWKPGVIMIPTFSSLVFHDANFVISVGNGGFPSQQISNMNLWCSLLFAWSCWTDTCCWYFKMPWLLCYVTVMEILILTLEVSSNNNWWNYIFEPQWQPSASLNHLGIGCGPLKKWQTLTMIKLALLLVIDDLDKFQLLVEPDIQYLGGNSAFIHAWYWMLVHSKASWACLISSLCWYITLALLAICEGNPLVTRDFPS